jgi:hypothetical protein
MGMAMLSVCWAYLRRYKRALFVGLLALIVGFVVYKVNRPKPEPSFHLLSNLTYEDNGVDSYGRPYRFRLEYVVITNPPEDKQALQVLVDKYNQETLSHEDLSKKTGYQRWFYRESSSLPRTYKELDLGYFDSDRIEDHVDDLLLIVKWKNSGKERTYDFQKAMPWWCSWGFKNNEQCLPH